MSSPASGSSSFAPLKVLLFGTHPKQFNGYSKVVYELAKELAKRPQDIRLTIFGFQNFYTNAAHRNDLPANVTLYDAFALEEPKKNGFGIPQVTPFVLQERPDVVVVYNDMVVVSQVVQQLLRVPEAERSFKIVVYMDQVYLNQKKEYVQFTNAHADHVLLFTPYWEQVIRGQGLTKPTGVLRHGINPQTYFPIPKKLARQFYGLRPDDFIVLNLNRNQPRKRWDTCLKAFAEVVSRHPGKPIKLLIATAVTGAWNLLEVYERELVKRGLTLEQGMAHLILFDNPQKVSDEDTNILYNVADIGINTCDGEGFGLCQFEQAAVGVPQVVPRLGGFQDFFDASCAELIEPCLAYYVDNTRDAVAGEALLCNYRDFADAIERYYLDPARRAAHGAAARARIVGGYGWEGIAAEFIEQMRRVCPPRPLGTVAAMPEPLPLLSPAGSEAGGGDDPEELAAELRQMAAPVPDIRTLKQARDAAIVAGVPAAAVAPVAVAVATPAAAPAQAAAAAPLAPAKPKKKKTKNAKNAIDRKTLLQLKKKLDTLLGDDDDA
jgi:glycosyltransferase involved in cell wall biosynthesis